MLNARRICRSTRRSNAAVSPRRTRSTRAESGGICSPGSGTRASAPHFLPPLLHPGAGQLPRPHALLNGKYVAGFLRGPVGIRPQALGDGAKLGREGHTRAAVTRIPLLAHLPHPLATLLRRKLLHLGPALLHQSLPGGTELFTQGPVLHFQSVANHLQPAHLLIGEAQLRPVFQEQGEGAMLGLGKLRQRRNGCGGNYNGNGQTANALHGNSSTNEG